jgi:O-antigen ligase
MKKKINAQHDSFLLKKISIICACIVPLLVTGPFLPDLIVSFLSLWFLYYSLKNKIYKIYKNIYFYFFIAFCLVCILSSILSDNIFISLRSSLFYVRIGVFALLISYLIDQNKKILNYFYYAFLVTFSSLVIDGYFQFFQGVNLFGFKIGENYRVSSFFGDELILGSYLSRLYPLFFAIFVVRSNKNRLEIIFVSILFVLIDVLIFFSGERASFVLFNLSTIFVIIFLTNYKWLRIGVFIVSLFVITILLLNDEKLYDRYVLSPKRSLGLDSSVSQRYFFSPGHDSLIRTSWKMFLDKPILGQGPKLYRIKSYDPKYQTGISPHHPHPHNFYVQLLAETGIIGFLFLAGLFFYFVYLIIKHIFFYFIYKKKWLSDYQICLLSGLLITIWPLTTNGSIFGNYLMLFYSLQIGFFKKNIKI